MKFLKLLLGRTHRIRLFHLLLEIINPLLQLPYDFFSAVAVSVRNLSLKHPNVVNVLSLCALDCSNEFFLFNTSNFDVIQLGNCSGLLFHDLAH